MSTGNKPIADPNNNTLTLKEGMDRTNNWREYVKGLFGDDYDKISRGFYIKIEDIVDLAEKYKEYNPSGVRVYFTLHNPAPPFDGVTGVLVPVIVEGEGEKKVYKDLIIPVPKGGDTEPEDELVSIYDLTRPCPKFCDLSSPLY